MNARVAAFVTFYHRPQTEQYLDRVLANLADFLVERVHVTIVTNLRDTSPVESLCRPYFAPADFSVVSRPNVEPPRAMTWEHKPLLREAAKSNFSHFIYLEDDIGLTFANFVYFNEWAPRLHEHGLIPSFLRTEFHNATLRSTDAARALPPRKTIRARGYTFASPAYAYCACFVMDRLLVEEYLGSKSIDPERSKEVCDFGIPQRAAMGLSRENIPEGFLHRYVVPVDADMAPLPCCLVQHMPANYATTPDQPLGKLLIREVFHG
jgi:hypothetical protein